MSNTKFKVGDRVRILGLVLYDKIFRKTGIVCQTSIDSNNKSDTYNDQLHECNGKCEVGYGWYYLPYELEHASPCMSCEDQTKCLSCDKAE